MSERVFINEELEIIEVNSYEAVTREDLFTSLYKVLALVKKTGITKVLVDTSEEEQIPRVPDLLEFGTMIPHSLSIAVVIDEMQPTAAYAECLRSAASIKGAVIEKFPLREDALKWLRK